VDTLYLIKAGLGIPDYWHPHLEIQTDFLSGSVGRYPVSVEGKAEYPGTLDADGIPVVFWGSKKGSSASAVNVALYGLGNYDLFLRTRNEQYYSRFLGVLKWLRKKAVPLGNGIGWQNDEDIPVFQLKAPWFSGITQGLVLSLFVRASLTDSGGPWRQLARETWLGFHCPVDEGGFCRHVPAGVIFEEYPGPRLDCVFNGMCVSLIGLWEAWKTGIVREAEEGFNDGINALHYYLSRFDAETWSYYSLNSCLKRGLLASPYYHRTNALLAKVIGQMAQDPEFIRMGEQWLSTSKSLTRRIYMSLRIGIDRYLNAPTLLHSDKSKA
jgi:hypothetical protein